MFLGRLFALLAALASSGTPLFAQTLGEAGWTAWQVAGARAAIGFAILALWVRGDLRLAKKHKTGVLITVVNSCVGMSMYPYAAMHASVGSVVCVLYLSLVWVMLYQRLALRSPERFDLASTGMVIGGVAMVVGPGGLGDTWQGIAAALLCSLTQSVYVIVSAKVTRVVPGRVLSAWALVGGTLVFGWQLLFAPWGAPHAAVSAVGIGAISGAAYLALAMSAFSRIGTETRMWLPFDLVFVWLFQTLVQGKPPTVFSFVGIELIFFAATLLAYGKRQALAPVVQSRPSS